MADARTTKVHQLAERDGLGQSQHQYHGRFRQSVLITAGFAVFGALVTGQFLLGGSTAVGLALLVVNLPFLGFTSWLCGWEFRHSNDTVYLFDGGLVHVSRAGAVHSYPWSAITEVRVRKMELSIQDIPVRTVHFVKLVHRDGATLVLNNRLRGAGALSATVQDAAARAQLPGALETLRGGQAISFDGILVDAQGVRHGDTTIPWPSIVTIAVIENITSTKVTIRSSGRRRPYTRRIFPSRPFPNLGLLMLLARALPA